MPSAKRFLACLLCALEMIAAVPALTAEIFTYADMNVNGVPAGTSVQEAIALLGEPLVQDAPREVPASGEVQQLLHYAGLTLTFTDDRLSDVDLVTDAYTTVRGLKLGDPESLLQSLFPYDAATAASEGILYSAGWVEALSLPLPPSGTVKAEETNRLAYAYLAPVTPYADAALESDENFVYEPTAMFVAQVDPASHVITRMQWSVHPLAE